MWGLLTLALWLDEDIESDVPVSESLFYNLEFHFLPTMARNNPEWRRIHIKAPLIADLPCDGRGTVATGISCGVDSLYTLATHSDGNVPPSHRINTLCFFNAGAAYYPGQPLRTPLVEGRLAKARKFAREGGYDFLFVESNLAHVYARHHPYLHLENHTYIMLFCTYMVQGALRHYYYSSGYPYNEFWLRATAAGGSSAGHYDLFTLKMASIAGLQYHSTGGDVTRLEKTRLLAGYEPATRHLNVCVKDVENCCTCGKCLRTIFSLEVLGVLDKFAAVFDIAKFNANRPFWLQELYMGATYQHDLFAQELLPYFRHEITWRMRLRTRLAAAKGRWLRRG